MLAKCVQECFHGPGAHKYTPDGGEKKDGVYDIDPMDPIATYFSFPVGTVKYHKQLGTVVEGGKIPPIPEDKPAKPPDYSRRAIAEKLESLGVKFTPTMGKDALMALLVQAQEKTPEEDKQQEKTPEEDKQ